jgi:hypothetical protein
MATPGDGLTPVPKFRNATFLNVQYSNVAFLNFLVPPRAYW